MSKLIYKSEKPYTEDLNDLVEAEEIAKGRGPDKQKRKARGSNTGHPNSRLPGESATDQFQRERAATRAHNEKVSPGFTEAVKQTKKQKLRED